MNYSVVKSWKGEEENCYIHVIKLPKPPPFWGFVSNTPGASVFGEKRRVSGRPDLLNKDPQI